MRPRIESEFTMSQVVQLTEDVYPFGAGEVATVTEIRRQGADCIYRLQGVGRGQTGWARGKNLSRRVNRAVTE